MDDDVNALVITSSTILKWNYFKRMNTITKTEVLALMDRLSTHDRTLQLHVVSSGLFTKFAMSDRTYNTITLMEFVTKTRSPDTINLLLDQNIIDHIFCGLKSHVMFSVKELLKGLWTLVFISERALR